MRTHVRNLLETAEDYRKRGTDQCDFRFAVFFSFSFSFSFPVIFSFSFVPEDVLMICLNTVHR